MTRGGGSGSRWSRRSRDQGAARGGWAPLAPPREAPARPGTRPSRGSRARLRRVAAAAAAAAAMSPGKPGAGGAGTRRTGWRRRRRRRRLEAATRAPGLGRTAGPDSRVPGTFQGARGMKRAAREARLPPRSPGLRWALPPLLLLLRLGQVSGPVGPGAGVGGGRARRVGAGLASPAPARVCPVGGVCGRWRGARGLRAPPLEGGSQEPSQPRAPATEPLPRCSVQRGGIRGPGVPVASQWKPPRWLQAVSGPALPRAGHIWPARARLARPRLPEGACLRRALVAERGRPG